MTGAQFKAGRKSARLTQVQAAARLGLSQPYVSQLERGRRTVPLKLAQSVARLFHLSPTALPLPEEPLSRGSGADGFVRALATLGYPGFAHVRAARAVNPARLVLDALAEDNLDARVSAALPWVLLEYPDLDWDWLVSRAKLGNLQNRLGFLVALARETAAAQPRWKEVSTRLAAVETELEHARLAAETTLGREGMPSAERRWLRKHRSLLARRWNVLTSLTSEHLRYGA